MVARTSGYFGDPFKGQRGVTQGDLLSSTIFNVVVDMVPNHWVTMVAVTERKVEPGTEGLVWDIQCMVEYFYADENPHYINAGNPATSVV